MKYFCLIFFVSYSCAFNDAKKAYINNVSHNIEESKSVNIFISEYYIKNSAKTYFESIWLEKVWQFDANKNIVSDSSKKQLLIKLNNSDALSFINNYDIKINGSEVVYGIQDDLIVFYIDTVMQEIKFDIKQKKSIEEEGIFLNYPDSDSLKYLRCISVSH